MIIPMDYLFTDRTKTTRKLIINHNNQDIRSHQLQVPSKIPFSNFHRSRVDSGNLACSRFTKKNSTPIILCKDTVWGKTGPFISFSSFLLISTYQRCSTQQASGRPELLSCNARVQWNRFHAVDVKIGAKMVLRIP